MATTTKSIRLDDATLHLLRALFEDPSIKSRSEADLLGDAAAIGLDLLKAQALIAGGQLDADPQLFARRLSATLLPLFEFLLRYDAVPHWVRASPASGLVSASDPAADSSTAPVAQAAPPTLVAPEAKTMLSAFGTNFLTDDDDD